MDEQADPVEHLPELRQGVRTDRRGELPRSLPIDDHLAGLKTPPEQVERCVLKDDCPVVARDRKSTRLNSSHVRISYAVFCLKKKKPTECYFWIFHNQLYARFKMHVIMHTGPRIDV